MHKYHYLYRTNAIIAFWLCSLLAIACTSKTKQVPLAKGDFTHSDSLSPEKNPQAKEVDNSDTNWFYRNDTLSEFLLKALRDNNTAIVALHIHPKEGLCVTPYAFVDSTNANWISQSDFQKFSSTRVRRKWGTMDGSGDPIIMDWSTYRKRFVWDKDYLAPTVQRLNSPKSGRGNSLYTLHTMFAGRAIVEFHMTGSERYAGMDWGSLYLVYKFQDNRWWLHALVHDQWTI